MKNILFLLLLCISPALHAQSADTGTSVRIFEDPRIDLIVDKPVMHPFTGKARGFRVQIYNGSDRGKANNIKMDFLRQHPGIRAYLIYNKPQFRVRVGDFTSRQEAAALYRRLTDSYVCMIVPDIINISPSSKMPEN